MVYKLKHLKVQSRRKFRKLEKRYREHPRLVPVLAAIIIVGMCGLLLISLRDSAIRLNRAEANIVIMHADNEERIIPTREQTVGSFIENTDLTLKEGDIVEPSLETEIKEDNFRVNVYRGKPVLVEDGENRLFSFSAATTPRSVATQVGLKLYPEDIVEELPSDDFLRDGIGSKVTVERSTPANLNLYGTALSLRTHAQTVGDLLKEKNVVLEETDTVKPGVDTPLSDKIQIFVTRFGTKVETVEEEIAMPVETIDDNQLSFGATAVRQQGSPGKRSVTYQLELKNGQVVSRKKIQEVIVVEPVKQIVARGTLVNIPSDKTAVLNAAGIPVSQHGYVNFIFSHESGWNAASISGNGCIGLGQNCPNNGHYWLKDSCPNWQTDPVCQTKRFTLYAQRYGGWEGAYNAWQTQGWW